MRVYFLSIEIDREGPSAGDIDFLSCLVDRRGEVNFYLAFDTEGATRASIKWGDENLDVLAEIGLFKENGYWSYMIVEPDPISLREVIGVSEKSISQYDFEQVEIERDGDFVKFTFRLGSEVVGERGMIYGLFFSGRHWSSEGKRIYLESDSRICSEYSVTGAYLGECLVDFQGQEVDVQVHWPPEEVNWRLVSGRVLEVRGQMWIAVLDNIGPWQTPFSGGAGGGRSLQVFEPERSQ